ncbi:hypothetical protein OG618_03055 [Kitasatospora sp. NBC_01246]|uniref:hypothetical protein n=1 Tax=Kitasatospora sp. NBC_01246 TaxID=2903570 RepID=UPI002E304452|nr:hypothetical protein [Kitasatospora sp. NBC_01246]
MSTAARPTRAVLVLAFVGTLLLSAAPQASAAGPLPGPYGTMCDPTPVRLQSPYTDWGKPPDPRGSFPQPIRTYGPTYLSTHPYKVFDPDRPFRRYQAELLTDDWGGATYWNICRGEGPSVYLTTWPNSDCLTVSDPVRYPNAEVTVNGCVENQKEGLKFLIHTNDAGWSVLQDERWGYYLDAVRTTYQDEVYGTEWIYTLKLSADNALAFRIV